MPNTAKIFTNGRSQAVRLPAQYRFEEKEVYIRRDPQTGDVVLSRKPQNWDEFFALLNQADAPADFLTPETRAQGLHVRDPFVDWTE